MCVTVGSATGSGYEQEGVSLQKCLLDACLEHSLVCPGELPGLERYDAMPKNAGCGGMAVATSTNSPTVLLTRDS